MEVSVASRETLEDPLVSFGTSQDPDVLVTRGLLPRRSPPLPEAHHVIDLAGTTRKPLEAKQLELPARGLAAAVHRSGCAARFFDRLRHHLPGTPLRGRPERSVEVDAADHEQRAFRHLLARRDQVLFRGESVEQGAGLDQVLAAGGSERGVADQVK
jgi:hypothetical protein